MSQKLVWNRFWMFNLSTGCWIVPFQIGIWHWVFLWFWNWNFQKKKKGKSSLLTMHHKSLLHINCIGSFYALANPIAGLGCNWIGTILLTSVKALPDSFSDVERKIKKNWRLLTFIWWDHFKAVALSSLNKISSIKEI